MFIQNKYITKINEVIDDLENTINNAGNNSTEFIETKIKKLNAKLQKILEGFNKKMESLKTGVETWYKDITDGLKINIVKKTQALFGLELPEEAIKALSDAIPVPPLVLPEFKIDLPDLSNIDINANVKFKRIPMIEIPGLSEAQDSINDLNNTIDKN